MSAPAPATDFLSSMVKRPRRNRKSSTIREMCQETLLLAKDLILPLFVCEGESEEQPIASLPGICRYSEDRLLLQAERALENGISSLLLFPVVPREKKDAEGSQAYLENNLINRTLRKLKSTFPELCLMVDIALDPYTDHGHDGIVNARGEILNDRTVEALGRQALASAQAGADVLAPSDMMDGRIGYLRRLLDHAGYHQTSLLAYSAKYASSLYTPFREALGSTLQFGDKSTYQLHPGNVREALLECQLDEEEGADFLLIKPGTLYLDVVAKVRQCTQLPLGVFHVSGEYAMVMAAAARGWLSAEAEIGRAHV
jgi:porphobilinogen synthase